LNEEYFEECGCGLLEVLFYHLLTCKAQYLLLAWKADLEGPKDFMGTKICRNYSEI